jgi:hypothetical protein
MQSTAAIAMAAMIFFNGILQLRRLGSAAFHYAGLDGQAITSP